MLLKRLALCSSLTVAIASIGLAQLGPESPIAGINAWDAVALDANQDGKSDIIVLPTGAAPARLFFLEGLGSRQFDVPEQLPQSIRGALRIEALDLDMDGIQDILATRYGGPANAAFVWLRGLGGAVFSDPLVIGSLLDVRDVGIQDLDGDGDPDLVVCSPERIVSIENLGGGNFGPQQIIDVGIFEACSVSDVDSDGFFDVVVAQYNSFGLDLYRGTSGLNFGPAESIETDVFSSTSPVTSDFNGDGFVDIAMVIGGLYAPETLAWFPGTAGGTFGDPQVISQSNLPLEILAHDCNADGLPDLLAQLGDVDCYENLGGGTFGAPAPFLDASNSIRWFRPADIDDDADLDFLATTTGSVVTSFENTATLGSTYCTSQPNSTGSVGSLVVTGSDSARENALVLAAADLPPASIGYFVTSQTPGMVSGPGGSQGTLCVSGAIGRYVGPGEVQSSGAAGTLKLRIDLSSTPTPTGPVRAVAGQTLYFQTWHRDTIAGSATSNFTDAVSLLLN